jgi:enamine deaminase RidA (YjgF/YER057c/UK114 family)
LGSELTIEQGYAAAREVGLILLAVIKKELGSLDNFRHIIKIVGMVNADSDFEDHPAVVNGCSDLLVEVFEGNGVHARVAMGVGSLPGRVAMAVDAIVEVC